MHSQRVKGLRPMGWRTQRAIGRSKLSFSNTLINLTLPDKEEESSLAKEPLTHCDGHCHAGPPALLHGGLPPSVGGDSACIMKSETAPPSARDSPEGSLTMAPPSWCAQADFVRTSTIALAPSSCAFLLLLTGAKIFRISFTTSLAPHSSVARFESPRTHSLRFNATTGRATCVSCATSLSTQSG